VQVPRGVVGDLVLERGKGKLETVVYPLPAESTAVVPVKIGLKPPLRCGLVMTASVNVLPPSSDTADPSTLSSL
jgi:hypothetical protein